MTDSSNSGLVNTIGNIPIGGIPVVAPITIRDEVHSGTELYHMVDRFFGGGLTAGQLHGELQPVCADGSAGKAQLEHIRHVLNSAAGYTENHVTTELQGILGDLMAAYQGSATQNMQGQFQKASTLLGKASPVFSSLATQIEGAQTTLDMAWQVVKDYSRLHADESNLSSMNPFGGGDSDDDKAEKAWTRASASLQGIGSQMASNNPNGFTPVNSSPYQPPNSTNPQATIPDPGSTGPGPVRGPVRAPGVTTPATTTPVVRDPGPVFRGLGPAVRGPAVRGPDTRPGRVTAPAVPAPATARAVSAPAPATAPVVPAPGPALAQGSTPEPIWRVQAPAPGLVSAAPARARVSAVTRAARRARPARVRAPAPAAPERPVVERAAWVRSRSAGVAARVAAVATASATVRPGSPRTTTYGATRTLPAASSPDPIRRRDVLC